MDNDAALKAARPQSRCFIHLRGSDTVRRNVLQPSSPALAALSDATSTVDEHLMARLVTGKPQHERRLNRWT
jgi:hypothetical protein